MKERSCDRIGSATLLTASRRDGVVEAAALPRAEGEQKPTGEYGHGQMISAPATVWDAMLPFCAGLFGLTKTAEMTMAGTALLRPDYPRATHDEALSRRSCRGGGCRPEPGS